MLVVKIEVHPRGDSGRVKVLKTIEIVNTGKRFGDYHLYTASSDGRTHEFYHIPAKGLEECASKALALCGFTHNTSIN